MDEFIASTRINYNNHHLIVNYKNYITNLIPLNVYRFIKKTFYSENQIIIWIPYSQIKNLSKIAEGGFSIIYKATWSYRTLCDIDVAIKKLRNSQSIGKYFLNEVNIFNVYC
jgi:hypothetical protein